MTPEVLGELVGGALPGVAQLLGFRIELGQALGAAVRVEASQRLGELDADGLGLRRSGRRQLAQDRRVQRIAA